MSTKSRVRGMPDAWLSPETRAGTPHRWTTSVESPVPRETQMTNDHTRLEQLLKARHPCIAIATAEDRRARARLVCDYLASMTDSLATRTYKRLFDPDFGSIVDLV